MSMHINRFLDKLKAAEARRSSEVSLPINEARDLHNELTRLLLKLEELSQDQAKSDTNQEINIEIQGGSF